MFGNCKRTGSGVDYGCTTAVVVKRATYVSSLIGGYLNKPINSPPLFPPKPPAGGWFIAACSLLALQAAVHLHVS